MARILQILRFLCLRSTNAKCLAPGRSRRALCAVCPAEELQNRSKQMRRGECLPPFRAGSAMNGLPADHSKLRAVAVSRRGWEFRPLRRPIHQECLWEAVHQGRETQRQRLHGGPAALSAEARAFLIQHDHLAAPSCDFAPPDICSE